jgi:hypothetical protein
MDFRSQKSEAVLIHAKLDRNATIASLKNDDLCADLCDAGKALAKFSCSSSLLALNNFIVNHTIRPVFRATSALALQEQRFIFHLRL